MYCVLILACLLTGCTDTVAPREPYDDSISIYGLLTPDQDTQFVWVHPIEVEPSLGDPDALEDVVVRSTDLETGETRVWEDTVMQRSNGQYEYLYRSTFRAEYGRSYRVEVYDGEQVEPAWAEVRIPPRPSVKLVSASRDTVTVDVLVPDANVMRTAAEYLVRIRNEPDTAYVRHYWGTEERIPGGWRVRIEFNIDRYWVEAWYVRDMTLAYPTCAIRPELRLGEMSLLALVGDTAWAPPGPSFDPYILSQPGTLQNVRNGTGFIGGGFRIDEVLDVPQEAVEDACFIYCSHPWVCIPPRRPGE